MSTNVNWATLPIDLIDHHEVREARRALDTATAELTSRRKALVRLEDGNDRERAQEADARAEADAIVSGKAKPKRKHVAEFDKRVDDLQHDVRVHHALVAHAKEVLEAVAAEVAGDWASDLEHKASIFRQALDTQIEAVASAHRDLSRIHSQLRALGQEAPNVGVVRFKPALLRDVEIAHLPDPHARRAQRAVVDVSDILGALRDVGKPEEAEAAPASNMAQAFKASAEHAKGLGDAWGSDFAAAGPAIRAGADLNAPGLHVGGVPVHIPGSEGAEN